MSQADVERTCYNLSVPPSADSLISPGNQYAGRYEIVLLQQFAGQN
jgi:hypothetical protein